MSFETISYLPMISEVGFTCLKSTSETPEQCVKSVQSQ